MPQRSSYTEGTPNWVDLQTTDPDAAKGFYSTVLGWDYDDLPMGGHGTYSIATLAGDMVAAILAQSASMRESGVPPAWNTYIAVDDADAASAKVAAAGGRVAMGPLDIEGGAGRMSFVIDPSGAAAGLYQAGTHIGATRVNEPGALTWNELTSSDLDAALPFYREVVGIEARPMDMGGEEYTILYVGDAMVGGATPPHMDGVPNHWHVWFAVSDADAAVDAARDAGGTVLVDPFDMPVGRCATIRDPQGAVFSVIKASPPPEQ